MEAKKPDDWDEDAPQFITDEDAVMPEGWLLDTPKLIPDPEAKMPEDWNEETDGEWEAPLVENPECTSAPGCGPWEKPKKINPKFKGKWSPPMIPNPAFKGIWKPRKIPNPNFFEDKHPYKMTPIVSFLQSANAVLFKMSCSFASVLFFQRALGLELWSMSADIAFDNFYIGKSKKGADDFAAETWAIKKKAEAEAMPSAVRLHFSNDYFPKLCILTCASLIIFIIVGLCC